MPCEATSGARLEENDGTSVLFTERGAAAACVAMYHRTCGRKSDRDRDDERSEWSRALALPPARPVAKPLYTILG
jgi:hypothetical protein